MSGIQNRPSPVHLNPLWIVVLAAFLAEGCATAPKQRSFTSAEQAVDELISTLRTQDRKGLENILGPEADAVLYSGDPVADRQRLQKFLNEYEEKHQLEPEAEGAVTLSVGNDDWPMPIPVVQDENGRWRFDTAAGKDEMLNRRIGQNELDVIEVCRAILDAQIEYAMADHDGDDVREYAEKFLSDAGQKNGLYWSTAAGERPSPLGPLVADAVDYQYAISQRPSGEPRPFHGYYYRMLESQGPNAAGGARDYVVEGNMIGGFGVVAYPAEYGNSGIMTMIVNQDGVVYQKDLGPESASIAKAMQSYDPGPGWERVPPEQPESATSAAP